MGEVRLLSGSVDTGVELRISLYERKDRRLYAFCDGEGGCDTCGRARGKVLSPVGEVAKVVVAVGVEGEVGRAYGGCSRVVVLGELGALS